MNKDILIERIEYLSSMPHSSLVEHCIYLENENDNYKAQKYITDFISENGIICEKNIEIKKLKNKINKTKEYINKHCVDEKVSKEVGYKCYTMADTNELEHIMKLLGDKENE